MMVVLGAAQLLGEQTPLSGTRFGLLHQRHTRPVSVVFRQSPQRP
jgi:hypothetical protein